MANLQKTIEIIRASRELSELCWRAAVETADTEAAAERFEQGEQDCDDCYSTAIELLERSVPERAEARCELESAKRLEQDGGDAQHAVRALQALEALDASDAEMARPTLVDGWNETSSPDVGILVEDGQPIRVSVSRGAFERHLPGCGEPEFDFDACDAFLAQYGARVQSHDLWTPGEGNRESVCALEALPSCAEPGKISTQTPVGRNMANTMANVASKMVGGVAFSSAALAVMSQFANPAQLVHNDRQRVIHGDTRETLLAYCLDGADAECAQGWGEYVDAIVASCVDFDTKPEGP